MLVVLDLLDQVRAGFLTAVLVLAAAASWPRVRHFCRPSETSSLTSQNTSARGSRTKIATQNSAAGLLMILGEKRQSYDGLWQKTSGGADCEKIRISLCESLTRHSLRQFRDTAGADRFLSSPISTSHVRSGWAQRCSIVTSWSAPSRSRGYGFAVSRGEMFRMSPVLLDVRLFGLRGTALCEEALCSFFFNVHRVLIQVSLFSTVTGDAWNGREADGPYDGSGFETRGLEWYDGRCDDGGSKVAGAQCEDGCFDHGSKGTYRWWWCVRVGWAFSWWNNLQGNTSDSAADRLLERSQEYDDGRCLCWKVSKQRQLGRNIFFFDVKVPVYRREEAVRKFAEKMDSHRPLRGTRWKLSGCRLLCHCRFSQLCHTHEQKRVHREMHPGEYDR